MSPIRHAYLPTLIGLLLVLLASFCLADTSCRFNAAGQLLNQPLTPAEPGAPSHGWGGVGGTGARQAETRGDRWGGIGGTGVAPAQPMMASSGDSWGGMGGTGAHPAPMPSTPLHSPSAVASNGDSWGGMGGTGVTTAPLAGSILFARGVALAQQGSLPARKIKQGDAVCQGDVIRTAADDSMLQIKMADQGMLMLYSDTHLAISRFHLPAQIDGSERVALMLEQGGMRAITGEIGKLNKANYLIATPVAQIHIRGTDHEIFHVPQSSGRNADVPAGTYNHVLRGGTTLSNQLGSLRLDPNQSGYAPLSLEEPTLLQHLPAQLRAMPNLAQATSGGATSSSSAATGSTLSDLPTVVTSNGISLNLDNQPVAAPAQSAYVGVTGAYGDNGETQSLVGLSGNQDDMSQVQLDPDSQLPVAVTLADGTLVFMATGDTQVVQSAQAQIDGVQVAWGVYSGGAQSDSSGENWQYTDYHDFAWSSGGATPMSVINSLSGTFVFNQVVGATTPTSENGTIGGQLNSLSVSMQFGANPGVTNYAVDVTDGNQRRWQAASTGFVSLSDFKSGQLSLSGSCVSAACGATQANGGAAGIVVGANGKGLITSYGLSTQQGDMVSGVAVLIRP